MASAQSTYFVKPGASGNGTSAQDAFGTIEQARDAIRARSDASIAATLSCDCCRARTF
jgi:hypothetical protein